MIKLGKDPTEPSLWIAETNDWSTPDGFAIAAWDGRFVSKKEYPLFIKAAKNQINCDVEPIGSFVKADNQPVFVFIVKSELLNFAIWRFKFRGMRWWYDLFAIFNGGLSVYDDELLPIIKHLNLKITN